MGCGCGKPTCNQCCGNVAKATPLNSCATIKGACAEDHTQCIVNQQFVASLKIYNSWNVPDCGGSATLSVIGLSQIAIGSYLWAANYGYFEVIGFNADSQLVTVQNNCIDGNAAEGTQVPALTEFTVTDPPLDSGSSSTPSIFPFVALDFTAPNVSVGCVSSLLITVTNVNGLVVGKNVQIGAGTYLVTGIPDGTHIEICNEGSGITPGTAVVAKNVVNQYQYPIILIDANPCTNDGIPSGCLVVCKDNIMSPLGATGLKAGMIPRVIADDECDVEMVMLDFPTITCTGIVCCLTLVPAQTIYTINVADSSQFVVGDVTQIGSRTDRFTITAIPDGTHVTGTLSPAPGALVDIDPGTSLCVVGCCELIETQFEEQIGNFQTYHTVDERVSTEVANIGAANPIVLCPAGVVGVTNISNLPLYLLVSIDLHIRFLARNAFTDRLTVEAQLGFEDNVNPPAIVRRSTQTYALNVDGDQNETIDLSYHTIYGPIAPAATGNLVHQGALEWLAAGAAEAVVAVNAVQSRMTIYGVAF